MPNPIRTSLMIAVLGLAVGCASDPEVSNPMEDPAYLAALEKQNQAIRSVTVYREVPTEALGSIEVLAASCSAGETLTGADINYVLTGLKLKAYKQGHNGIADVDIGELENINGGCPGSLPVGGTAKAFSVPL